VKPLTEIKGILFLCKLEKKVQFEGVI